LILINSETAENIPRRLGVKAKNCVITGILAIGSVFFSCAANKGVTESGMSVTAKGTSEGIVLYFSDIPEDTTDIALAFVDVNARNQPENVVFVNNANLDELKKTGNLLCPFGKNGREYFIRVYRHTELGVVERQAAGAVAGGGIYLTNNPLLRFTNGNNTLTLSEMPAFSEEVSFSRHGLFIYYSYLRRDDGTYLGFGADATNNLNTDSWRPKTEIKEYLARDFSIDFTGDMPVFATAHCLLSYGNMEWNIGLAQSEDTVVSF
jgi:hypothetical protein